MPATHSPCSTARISLGMSTADAAVLFDWHQDVDVETLPISHRSQRQALRDLEALLDVSVVPPDEDQLRTGQADVACDMGR